MKHSIVVAWIAGLTATMVWASGGVALAETGQSRQTVTNPQQRQSPPTKPKARAPRKAADHSAPGSDRSFNPQPELPERKANAAGRSAPGADRSFNPQPELPERRANAAGRSAPGADRSFNPQPELPERKAKPGGAVKVVKPGSTQTFNPQPELPETPAPAAGSH